jgi:hypothetical protein
MIPQLNDFMESLPKRVRENCNASSASILSHNSLLCHRVTNILNGSGKKTLWDKILRLISTRSKEYLGGLGYAKDAVPYQYTSERPKDLEPVRQNLVIVNSILSTNLNSPCDSGESDGFDSLLDRVSSEIYEEIDPFIEDMMTILDEEWIMLVRDEQWTHIKFRDQLTSDNIDNLRSDLKHLQTMKEMDENIRRRRNAGTLERQSFELSAVVPISGLVMSKFCRLQVELKTVLEIWDHPTITRPTSPSGMWII